MSQKIDLFKCLEGSRKVLEERNDTILTIPCYILKNIKYSLYEWQENALKNFFIYNNTHKENNKPTHLMFNMATGSGKTLLMASLILFYYKHGHRHFLFFVNQNNIVDKTENNFLDYTHKKYLFNKTITIDNKPISIKKVDMFSDNPKDIEIKFTTIQKLHNDMRIIKENTNTLSELSDKDIVMFADEGHHFNSITKNSIPNKLDSNYELTDKSKQQDIENAWEYTVVNMLLHKGKNYKNNNVLLEFTATIPEHESIENKYKDKIVYKFPLIEFLKKGYTKEINLVSSQSSKKERILFALLFNWYRHKLAIIFRIPNFKPVMLLRSKTIEESKSDYNFFINMTLNLSKKDFDFLDKIKNQINLKKDSNHYITKAEFLFKFIINNKIDYEEIISFIKSNFGEKNIVITNSKENISTSKEKTNSEIDALLNNLEDKNNIIRAIFTVDRLTEGWDVLNLFDIVRISEGQNSGGVSKCAAKATVKEAQLIGRGVRYYPFLPKQGYDTNYYFGEDFKTSHYKYEGKDNYKRKFDNDITHPLRILEEINYYTYNEHSRYITDLKGELSKHGYIDERKEKREFYIKDKIKETDFYKNTKIFYNELEQNTNRIKKTLSNIKVDFKCINYRCRDTKIYENEIEKDYKKAQDNFRNRHLDNSLVYIKDIPKNIFYKAMHLKASRYNSMFSFERLKKELDIGSIDDLYDSEFLGDFQINFIFNKRNKIYHIESRDKLNALSIFLDEIFNVIENGIIEKVGTKFSEKNTKSFEDIFGEKKIRLILKDKGHNFTVADEDWFMLNDFVSKNSEESFINFIKYEMDNLKEKYDEVYLLRNEEVYRIYSPKNGSSFKPDFLLFLKEKDKESYFQVLIESKIDSLIESEKWKNDILKEISLRYKDEIFRVENTYYRIRALPFYTEDNKTLPFDTFNNFEAEFRKLL